MLSGRPGWRLTRLSWCAPAIALLLASSASVADSGNGAAERARHKLGGISVPFVANAGQTDPAVAYYATTFAGTVFVTRQGQIVHSFPWTKSPAFAGSPSSRSAGWSLTETLVGGNTRPTGGERASTRVSYFIGNDPSHWRSGLETFAGVSLGEVWPGISLELRAHGKDVEKLFTVEPGADPLRIRVRVEGGQLRINADSALVVGTALGDVVFTPPLAFQEQGNVRHPVRVAYQLRGKEYGFRLGDHDPAVPVIIDPLLQATYLGGSGTDGVSDLAIHPTSGDVYVAGGTSSTNFPGTSGGALAAQGGLIDGFVARLNAGLTTLIQATYLGGSGIDGASGLAIHPTSGDVYVAGSTDSTDFPGTAGGAQAAYGGGIDAFVARLNSALTTLTRATYLGGSNDDRAVALVIHPTSGDVYVTGFTNSMDFPGSSGGAQAVIGGDYDAFVARLNASLTTLAQTTYLGGSNQDVASVLAIHPTSGDVYVAGGTRSTDFPGTAGGAQAAYGGGVQDGFVARLNTALTTLAQATYLGGSGPQVQLMGEACSALAIHPASGDVYVAGFTRSTDFPGTAGGAQAAYGGGVQDGFVARLSANLKTLAQSTYLGGSDDDRAVALVIHPTSGDVYVAGFTMSTNFPGSSGGAQAVIAGGYDAFVARLNTALTTLAQTTYLGGSNDDFAYALAIHPTSGDVYAAGGTASTDFPGTAGGAQAVSGLADDGFIARLTVGLVAVEPTPTNTPTSTPTNTPTATPPVNIPTTSEGGLLVLGLFLAALGYFLLRSISAGSSA